MGSRILAVQEVTITIMPEEISECSFILTSPRSKLSVHSSGVSEKIRLGTEYQTEIPELLLDEQKQEYELETEEPSVMLWSSTTSLPDEDIEKLVKNTDIVPSKLMECYFGTSITWTKPVRIFPTLLQVQMNGMTKKSSCLKKDSNGTGNSLT